VARKSGKYSPELRAEVVAAVTLPYHNLRTEGVNTRTKRIMRQMRGRAGFDLLRHRILLP
jgi:transposase